MADSLISSIHLLDTQTANQIAAGEVVERPLSVVKELVENAIDAAAKHIEVKIFDASAEKIQVADDGIGMDAQDLLLCVKRHATSKIRRFDDLQNLHTLGFRGEALPSVAAVSILTITSKQAQAMLGYRVRVEAGKPSLPEEAGARNGTIVLVERLFYNAPARKKFLKSPRWELGLISDCLQKLALSHPHIVFKFVLGSRTLFASPGDGELSGAIQAVYGREAIAFFVELAYEGQGININGLTALPDYNRAERGQYTFFVNGRWIKSRELNTMVDEAYHTLLPRGRYPLIVMNITLPQHSVDVNVHPAKLEIKFQQPDLIKEGVQKAIGRALRHKEGLAPRLKANRPLKTPALTIDPQSGFIIAKAEENKVLHLRETPAPPLNGKSLAERLYGKSDAKMKTPVRRLPEEQKVDFFSTAPKDAAVVEEDNPSSVDNSSILRYSELNVLGQAQGTYIVATGEDGVYFIDQHAAHERILYEKIMEKAQKNGGASRMLALPQTMQLTIGEYIQITESILELSEAGFVLEHFGEQTYIIRGAPLWYDGQDAPGFLRDYLANKSAGTTPRREEIFLAACKQAVKANRYLTNADIGNLLSSLDKCTNASTCPHGRPIAVKISFTEIKKRFLR
ncbi:MAG: DNA mismatch repair endonuclease MutL [Firmicutes bacterium]|nr:DNA mismatch repair endonuclease MutL [Bacillota bacterium]